ncbi:MAG TPA: efflux RND transporter permease subunit [Thermoanaerobaculia bacterium]|nr:efflux RND transporter permease subunit [Thermoanaerobaculia bacterium]
MSRERGPDVPAEDPPAETPDPGRQEPPDEPPLLPDEPIEEPDDSPIQDLPPRRDPETGEPPQGDPPAGPPQQVRAGFARFVTGRPVAVLMLFLAAVVFGWFSYRRLPVTLMPELSYPTLTVRTEYPGAAPEEVENDISRPLEEALGIVSGLRRISSVSRAGLSDVVLEFAWDTDLSAATQDTLEKLDLVFLPEDAERPLILHYDPSLDPVLELSLSGQGDRFRGEEGLRRLRRLAELQVKRALEPIKGVAAVRVRGGLEEEIHVLLDDDALRRTGLSIQAVIDRLRQENINVAGGTIQEGRTEYMVRTLNEYRDLREIGETVVASREGRDVRVQDLGRVVRAHKEREMLTRTDGGESVQVDVFKEADANIVAVADRVREALGDAQKEGEAETRAPPAEERGGRAEPVGLGTRLLREEGARLQIVADRSVFIRASIAELRDNCILGGLLAVFVLLVFLREFRATAIVAVNIPIALLLCFAPLHLSGVSLNIMSLGGLALGIGMLVDCSIVVLESISRCREEGDDLLAAAIRGTNEVGAAVISSTLTSVAVFFPMVFVEGIAGQAFSDLGLAVVVSQFAALAVALFLVPMLASRRGAALGDPQARAAAGRALLRRPLAAWLGFRGDWRRLRGWIAGGKPLVRALRLLAAPLVLLYLVVRLLLGALFELLGRLVLLLIVAATRLWGWTVAPAARALMRLLSRGSRRAASGRAGRLRTAYPAAVRWGVEHPLPVVAATALLMAGTWLLASRLSSELLPEVHQGEFTFEVALPVGTPLEETEAVLAPVEQAILEEREHLRSMILAVGFDAANAQRADEGEHSARFKLLLNSSDPEVEEAVIARLRARLAEIPDLSARVVRPVLFSTRTPIEVEVHGDDLRRLRAYSERARAVMAALPELADVEATLRSGAPEVQIVYDRDRLARFGLDLRRVAELVRDQVKGREATRFNQRDRRVPIVVRLEERDREAVEDVRGLVANPEGTTPIPLAAVAQVALGEGPSEVRRVDSRRVGLIRANLSGIGAGGAAGASLGDAAAAIERALTNRIDWPADMTFVLAGQTQEWERSRGSLWLALGLSVFLVYVIMAAQFESLLHPLVILFTIPLAFFGTVATLWALGISLSVVVFLGMIMLAGIVVNNAIVLIDYINVLRRRGLPRDEAIVTAGVVRLRPILMTTATTVLGLLPMVFGVGDGAEIRTPMAIAVISGLVTSTALTLFIIPSIYALVDRLQGRLLGREEAATASAAAGAAGPQPLRAPEIAPS